MITYQIKIERVETNIEKRRQWCKIETPEDKAAADALNENEEYGYLWLNKPTTDTKIIYEQTLDEKDFELKNVIKSINGL